VKGTIYTPQQSQNNIVDDQFLLKRYMKSGGVYHLFETC